MKPFFLIICIIIFSSQSNAQDNVQHNAQGNAQAIISKPPEHPKTNGFYVFYSHGLIVEGENSTPIHDSFGVYDFPAIKKALADPTYTLIAHHRALKTDPFSYAKSLSEQVTTLLDNGVPAQNITLVGFSRGGFITALASNELANKELNIVIMAACTSRLAKDKAVVVYGNLLSIYETSDSVGSCNDVVGRASDAIVYYQEIAISTGKKHGAFYTPDPTWLIPLKEWIKRNQQNATLYPRHSKMRVSGSVLGIVSLK